MVSRRTAAARALAETLGSCKTILLSPYVAKLKRLLLNKLAIPLSSYC
jgi:hypothetical protein